MENDIKTAKIVNMKSSSAIRYRYEMPFAYIHEWENLIVLVNECNL